MAEYNKWAPCGFCRYYGQKHGKTEVCEECEIQMIRHCLEDLLDKVKFDHDHKYRHIIDEQIHNCAHCEHGLTYETRYEVAATNGDVWCTFSNPTGEGNATNKGSDICGNWQRAADYTVWREACDTP